MLARLTRLVTVDESGRRARRRVKLNGLTGPLSIALQVFVDRRLLLSDTDDDGQVWLTVAHEALLSGWRPLDTATADITVALRTARTVEHAAADWNSAGRPEHYLWEAERLTTTLATLGTADDGGRNPGVPSIIELDDGALAFLRRHRPTRPCQSGARTASPVFAPAAAPWPPPAATRPSSCGIWPRLDSFPDGEVREACIRAGGALDKATWGQYAPGVSYQDTCADR